MEVNNKKVAKNTIILYGRMLILMFIGLFTSRLIIQSLGIVDFGINNVVSGIVPMFSFVVGALGAATSRFITFELGTGNTKKLNQVYRTAFTNHIFLSIVIVILLETVGLYLLNNTLVLPENRKFAANVIYQFTIIGAFLTLTQIPLNALITAHENFNVYAYVTIFDVLVKLGITYLLFFSKTDKLILFGFLLLILNLIQYIFYNFYCKSKFEEYSIKLYFNKKLFFPMLTYSGWSLFGSMAYMFKTQGINIVLNIFLGPVINAAFGVASQVNEKVNSFVSNFSIALNPPIVKSFAAKDYDQTNKLLVRGGRFSYYIMLIFTVPIVVQCNIILHLWLKEVPPGATIFTQLIMVNTLLETLSYSAGATIQATGKIKWYQIIIGSIVILNFPITYFALYVGLPPYTSIIIAICLTIISLFVRIFLMQRLIIFFDLKGYCINVFLNCFIVSLAAVSLPLLINYFYIGNIDKLILILCTSVLSTFASIWLIGLSGTERVFFNDFLKRRFMSYKLKNHG